MKYLLILVATFALSLGWQASALAEEGDKAATETPSEEQLAKEDGTKNPEKKKGGEEDPECD